MRTDPVNWSHIAGRAGHYNVRRKHRLHLTERRYASSSTKMRRYQPPDDLRKFLQAL
jgi:hypothetical protein